MRSDLFHGFEDIHVPDHHGLGATATGRCTRPTACPAGVEVRRLRDCGHVPTWDSPEQVAAVIREGAARALGAAA